MDDDFSGQVFYLRHFENLELRLVRNRLCIIWSVSRSRQWIRGNCTKRHEKSFNKSLASGKPIDLGPSFSLKDWNRIKVESHCLAVGSSGDERTACSMSFSVNSVLGSISPQTASRDSAIEKCRIDSTARLSIAGVRS